MSKCDTGGGGGCVLLCGGVLGYGGEGEVGGMGVMVGEDR